MPKLTRNAPDERSYSLNRRMTSIGSAPTNDIVIGDDPRVEESHAVIQFDGEAFQIQSAARKAEVLINGKRKKKATLAEGDVIELGDTQLVLRILEEPTRPAAAASTESVETAELAGFRKLKDLSERMLADWDLPVLLEHSMDAVVELTHADKGFLILFRDGEPAIKVARNVHRENIDDAIDQVSDSIIQKVVERREPLIVSDALHDEEFNASQSVINLNLCSVMCVPLLNRGELLGLIYVGNDDIAHLFEPRHLDLLTTFAAQASLIVANALAMNELRLDNELLHQRLEEKRYGSIIGACDAMREVYRTIEKVAPTAVNVLVLGETGTGKELIANEIHLRSPRARGPFVTINCGAIPENLLESELFGHVKGSFTGASATREGKFQAADGGTIFLDEIGEMPVNLQVKLLRVLQERTITRVGATRPEKVDIRVVAATNRNLEEAVRAGEFREDLFYRLNVVMLRLPPLRDRGHDIVLIARYLIGTIAEDFGMAPKSLSPEAIAAMKSYAWPGNIRQLENRLKKAMVLSDGTTLTPEDLELSEESLEPVMTLADAKEHFAYRYIMEALERNGGNRTQTARELGVDPRTIFRYLEKDI